MPRALAVAAVLLMASCSGGGSAANSPSPAAPSPTPAANESPPASPSGSPTAQTGTQASCVSAFTPSHPLMLFEIQAATPPILEVVDVSNVTRPVLECTISPAQGGRFAGSAAKLLFWNEDRLGTANVVAGTVTLTAQLPFAATEGAFSADGSAFAYRVTDAAGGMTLHVFSGGSDRVLYSEPAVGGHGVPPYGPYDQLAFSPDGSLLLDYQMFRPSADIDNLQVFSTAGAKVFSEPGTVSGVWAPAGATLYYPTWGEGGATGEIDSFDVADGSKTVATGLNGYYWPVMAPDGGGIVYDTYDSSVAGCGGLPHLWRLDLVSKQATQLARAVTSHPVFVRPDTVWSNEEKQTACGINGPSARDGAAIAHNVSSGSDATVDMRFMTPGTGGLGMDGSDVGSVVDMWPQR